MDLRGSFKMTRHAHQEDSDERAVRSLKALYGPPRGAYPIIAKKGKRIDSSQVMEKKVLRRNQSKMNQRRYRAEQKAVSDYLHSSVATLTMDVARLEGRVESLLLTVPTNLRTFAPELSVAKEYFRLFLRGYARDASDPMHVHQRDFLHSVMHDDLDFMNSVGIDKLFAQWALYNTIFPSINMEAEYCRVVTFAPEVMLEAKAVMHLRISRATIEALFPHLIVNEPLVQRLVGRVMTLTVFCQFSFDETFRIRRFNTIANPVEALLGILHSLEDTVTALAGLRLGDNAELSPPPQWNNQIDDDGSSQHNDDHSFLHPPPRLSTS
ncbi:Aste57867_16009 [Aphanomyces stellatus]|uniref:Aste57867_16009 protein n=1 Tax=Aphanomyces stellatus TaxID=120398 RepID=A0A485L4S5_9STRA|nr:hypothetical protein As57867_015953 [Aphanomyces stellatus]VFT92794.1 Aste57867_16009 [Aphanomyces stellatus]